MPYFTTYPISLSPPASPPPAPRRYLNEPESALAFLARAVDPLTDPATGTVPLDPLVALLMAEYQKRVGA